MTAPTPAHIAAYDAGRQAYIDGRDSLAVVDVYPDGSTERHLWIKGWVQCRAEALYGPRPRTEETP